MATSSNASVFPDLIQISPLSVSGIDDSSALDRRSSEAAIPDAARTFGSNGDYPSPPRLVLSIESERRRYLNRERRESQPSGNSAATGGVRKRRK